MGTGCYSHAFAASAGSARFRCADIITLHCIFICFFFHASSFDTMLVLNDAGLVKMKTASAKSRSSNRHKERAQDNPSDKSAKPILSASSALAAMNIASNPLFPVHIATGSGTEGIELKQTCIETAESPVKPVQPAHIVASLDPAVSIENVIL
jgi:hypothetical protein